MPDAGDFRVDVFGDQIEVVRSNLEEMVNERVNATTERCRERLSKDLQALYDTLQDPKTIVRSALYDNLKFTAELIPLLNVLEDPELKKQAETALALIAAHPINDVRMDEEIRAQCAAAARQ